MFGIFGKKKSVIKTSENYIDMDNVKVFYEGEVICGDYDLNNPEAYPFHNLFPEGKGKIKYMIGDRIVEEYKGNFKGGQYHGDGVLIDKNGEVFEGQFSLNNFKFHNVN